MTWVNLGKKYKDPTLLTDLIISSTYLVFVSQLKQSSFLSFSLRFYQFFVQVLDKGVRIGIGSNRCNFRNVCK